MDWSKFAWRREEDRQSVSRLTTDDVEALRRLLLELRDTTLSRASHAAASEFLDRLGGIGDGKTSVRSHTLAP